MYAKSTTVLACLLAASAGLTTAIPTKTMAVTRDNHHDDAWHETDADSEPPTGTEDIDPEQVTHTVVAGLGGLNFEPNNIVAEKGSIVEFHFLPENHAVVQSSFGEPCQPLIDDETHEEVGFFSGFNFEVDEGQADKVFQIEVTDPDTPVWFYCPQGNHCQSGMVGVVNQNFDNPDFSLSNHVELAANTNETIIPEVEQGGRVIENPNPDGGF